MKIRFHKYHGTGNDFILIDNRELGLNPGQDLVAFLCNRRFGIGADGLMLLNEKPGFDFAMRYYNSDGRESTMCGNGGRCMTAFASQLGLILKDSKFFAADGEHISSILANEGDQMIISLKMQDVSSPFQGEGYFFIHTGSPHYVIFSKEIDSIELVEEARKIRYSERFAKEGTNVDWVEFKDGGLFVRSYERGVEDETLSCGTGATASALAAALLQPENPGYFRIATRGGELKVHFTQRQKSFTDIWLEGPARFVFTGEITI